MLTNTKHIPVLLKEVLHYLAPFDGAYCMDATFGAGGYSRAILESANCNLISIDRDETVAKTAEELQQIFNGRFTFAHGEFANIKSLAYSYGIKQLDRIVFDIGVSSMQLDQPERGFSFMHEGKLDMRMDSGKDLDAYYIVNHYTEKDLAEIIYHYGDERKSRAIARAIVNARSQDKIDTTIQLASIIKHAVGKYNDKINPATRTFQALRIAVNDELQQLEQGLNQAIEMLATGGRIVVVTFHSGEDKIVKALFNKLTGRIPNVNRHMMFLDNQQEKKFATLHKGVIVPSAEEIKYNPRARSAKLRAIEKL